MKILVLATVLGALGASSLSHAQVDEFKDEKIRFSGFTTLAYAKLLDSDEGFIGEVGADEKGEYRNFSKVGLRLNADLDDKLSFGMQILASGNGEVTNSADYTPNVDWLYINYKILPNLTISVGKTTMPLFMFSDYLDTSYAYQWLVAPSAVYNSSNNPKATEGIRVNWKADLGGAWSSNLIVWAGQTDEYLADLDTNLTIYDSSGLAWEVERDWLTFRGIYFQGNASAINSSQLDGVGTSINQTLSDVGFAGADVTTLDAYNDVLWEDDKASFTGFGLAMDFEHVFFVSEITRIELHDLTAVANQLDSWYAMIGTRIPGNVSLSLTYSEDDNKTNGDDIAGNLAGDMVAAFGGDGGGIIDQTLTAIAQGTGDTIDEIQFQKTENITFSTRWDFHHSASLKFEYLKATIQTERNGDKNKPSAFMVGMDLVF